jgi:hypothetical protein
VFGQCDEVELVKKITAAGNGRTTIETITFSRK